MKKFLSLIMVAAMLVAVFAMVGCDGNGDETTTSATTTETTTSATTTATTTTETTTTETTTTETTTTETTTTETTTTETTTTETTTTATTESTTSATTATTSATTGATLGVFDRFDFGTASKAEAIGETSHQYIVENLKYDAGRIALEWTEDTVVIYATKSYDSAAVRDSYALVFEDIVTFDFMDEMVPGWGGFSGAPLNPGTSWGGVYQYAKVRIKNSTTNNIMSVHWHRAGEGYSTRTACIGMYLQGGAPSTTTDHKKTADVQDEWKSYIYDMMFLASVGREVTVDKTSYMEIVTATQNKNSYFGSNWNTANGKITAMNFHFLGAYAPHANFDTRSNIKMGDKVEVDYIVFGCSIEQLEAYTSNMEDAA